MNEKEISDKNNLFKTVQRLRAIDFFSHHLMWVYRNAIKTQTKKATPDDKYLNIDITFMQQRGRKKLTWRLIFNRVLAFSTFSVDYFAFVVTTVKFNRSMDLEDLIIKHWCKKKKKKKSEKKLSLRICWLRVQCYEVIE